MASAIWSGYGQKDLNLTTTFFGPRHVETGANSQSVYTLLAISALSACLAAVAARCAGFHVAQSLLLPRAQETAWDISILYALNHWGHITFSVILAMAIFKGLVVEACDTDVIERMWRAVSFMIGECWIFGLTCFSLEFGVDRKIAANGRGY
jgi:hypothetical protein